MLKLASKVYVATSKVPDSGKGVFAAQNLKKGEVIEVSPILVLVYEDIVDTKWNLLFEYYFWMDDFIVLALGYGSLYNHSDDPNAKYKISKEKKTITFKAIKDIKKGEEIYFNYKGTTNPKTPLWFQMEKSGKIST